MTMPLCFRLLLLCAYFIRRRVCEYMGGNVQYLEHKLTVLNDEKPNNTWGIPPGSLVGPCHS